MSFICKSAWAHERFNAVDYYYSNLPVTGMEVACGWYWTDWARIRRGVHHNRSPNRPQGTGREGRWLDNTEKPWKNRSFYPIMSSYSLRVCWLCSSSVNHFLLRHIPVLPTTPLSVHSFIPILCECSVSRIDGFSCNVSIKLVIRGLCDGLPKGSCTESWNPER